ncbi:MAG: rRNA maturation RNase YbeY [Rhizobacter sp.]|nr:rRNA maturation RNase YbeY [Ferruginibacter sp.]
MSIEFNFPVKVSLANRARLKEFIILIFRKEKKKMGDISFVFCSDGYLLEINRAYLNHHYFTDIITFDLSQQNSGIVDGEIYISVDTVKANAKRFHTTLTNELHRVIFHGVLHLCGYNDKTARDQSQMTEMEDHYLALFLKRST